MSLLANRVRRLAHVEYLMTGCEEAQPNVEALAEQLKTTSSTIVLVDASEDSEALVRGE